MNGVFSYTEGVDTKEIRENDVTIAEALFVVLLSLFMVVVDGECVLLRDVTSRNRNDSDPVWRFSSHAELNRICTRKETKARTHFEQNNEQHLITVHFAAFALCHDLSP